MRNNSQDFDSQKIYEKLCEHAKQSMAAHISKEKVSTFLTTGKLESTWRGSSSGFIHHWHAQMRNFEEMSIPAEFYSDTAKKYMLIASVKGIPEFRYIQSVDESRVASGANPLSYDSYLALLESAASRRDDDLGIKFSRSKRIVNAHDSCFSEDINYNPDSYVDNGDSYYASITPDSDTLVDYSVYQALQQSSHLPYIPPALWRDLGPEIQKKFLNFKWDQASNNQGSNHKLAERGAQMNYHSLLHGLEGSTYQ